MPPELDVPERRIVVHNPSVCAVRITREEALGIGRAFAEKVNAATGPAAVVLPLGGCSSYELPEGPFVDPGADAALFEAIRAGLRPGIELHEVEANINEPAAATAICETFLRLKGPIIDC